MMESILGGFRRCVKEDERGSELINVDFCRTIFAGSTIFDIALLQECGVG